MIEDKLFAELNGLFADLPKNSSINNKIRLIIRQLNLKIISLDSVNNSYLTRLIKECELFLPELFQDRWTKKWEYPVSLKLDEVSWVRTEVDFAIDEKDEKNEVRVIDWSGKANNPYAISQAYLLLQQLSLRVEDVSVVSLINNDLGSNLNIKFVRQYLSTNDLVICEQDLSDRFAAWTLRNEAKENRPDPETALSATLAEIDSFPEVSI